MLSIDPDEEDDEDDLPKKSADPAIAANTSGQSGAGNYCIQLVSCRAHSFSRFGA